MDISEVLTEMIKRACLYTAPTTATTVTSSTTAFRSKMKASTTSMPVEEEKVDALDEVVAEPVVSSTASYPNLVSTHLLRSKLKCNK